MNRFTEEEASVIHGMAIVFGMVIITIVLGWVLILLVASGWSTPAFAQAEKEGNSQGLTANSDNSTPAVADEERDKGEGDAADTKSPLSQVTVDLTASDFDHATFIFAPAVRPEYFVDCIDNRYYPLPPGRVWQYRGETADGVETSFVTVTNQSKVVLGITTTVVRDTVFLDGQLSEDTYDWYAQDVRGHVWYFGEEVNNYENGQLVNNSGSWEAGVNGAVPGIIMLKQPLPGDIYRQEYLAGAAEDMGGVLQLNASVSVPAGTYNRLLVTADYNPLDEELEHKYYARGIGLVKEEIVGSNETSELIAVSNEQVNQDSRHRCGQREDD